MISTGPPTRVAFVVAQQVRYGGRRPVLTILEMHPDWVFRTSAKSATMFDIVSAVGKVLATATLGALKRSVYVPFVVRDNNVPVVSLDEDDVPRVERYRI